jgi:hypothetical protein
MGKRKNDYGLLVGKFEGKRRRWDDNIRMDLREMA